MNIQVPIKPFFTFSKPDPIHIYFLSLLSETTTTDPPTNPPEPLKSFDGPPIIYINSTTWFTSPKDLLQKLKTDPSHCQNIKQMCFDGMVIVPLNFEGAVSQLLQNTNTEVVCYSKPEKHGQIFKQSHGYEKKTVIIYLDGSRSDTNELFSFGSCLYELSKIVSRAMVKLVVVYKVESGNKAC